MSTAPVEGELIIEDMLLYTEFPDKPIVTFTNPEYASEITYEVIEGGSVIYEDGYFEALEAGNCVVEATTQYHKTTFNIETKVYADPKGSSTTSFYLSRVKQKENYWKNKGALTNGTIFIGDSFFDTEFFSNFYTLYEGNNAFTTGVSSSTTTDWEIFATRLLYPMAPKNVVIHCGTNNIYDDYKTAKETTADIERLIELIHKRLPETTVYCFAIEPRTYRPGGGNFDELSYNLLTEVNQALDTYAESKDYVKYVDVTSHCYTSGYSVNSSFCRDGTHPTLENYLIYAEALKEAGLDLIINEKVGKVESTTTEISFGVDSGVGGSVNVKVDDANLVKEYSVSGKFKVNEIATNPHIQFSFDTSNFQNRFLFWDHDANGVFNLGYACNGNHITSGCATTFNKDDKDLTFELVTSSKHAYLYLNGNLELVFTNVNASTLLIGSEACAVDFTDIVSVTKSKDETSYNQILARTEIAKYETGSYSSKAVIDHN